MSTEPSSPQADPVWPLAGWVLFALAVTIFLIAILVNAIMPAVVLDVVSFWPAWIVATVVAGFMWPLHRKGIARVGAIAPLLLFSWLVGAVGLHYSSWDQLPSSAGDLAGPEVGAAETAQLRIEVAGTLIVVPGTTQLYEVDLIRSGGSSGPAEALERRTDSNVVVELMERPDAGWFESAGWNVTISRTPAWSLVVSASEVEIDLATVPVESLDVVADGVVRVGSPLGDVAVRIAGSVELSIPTSATVEIIGTASVPNGWTETDTGWFNEGSGTSRFVVTVDDGASLTVRQW